MFTYPVLSSGPALFLDATPQAWWDFEESNGAFPIADQVGVNAGDIDIYSGSNGSTSQVAGKVGFARYTTFGQLKVGPTTPSTFYEIFYDSWSLNLWLRCDDTAGYPHLFNLGNSSIGNLILYVDPTSDGVVFKWRTSTDGNVAGGADHYIGVGTQTTGQWIMATVQWDKPNQLLRGSVNGAALGGDVATGPEKYAFSLTAGIFSLGLGNWWDGAIDSWGIWSGLLSDDDVAALYNGGDGLNYAQLTAL